MKTPTLEDFGISSNTLALLKQRTTPINLKQGNRAFRDELEDDDNDNFQVDLNRFHESPILNQISSRYFLHFTMKKYKIKLKLK